MKLHKNLSVISIFITIISFFSSLILTMTNLNSNTLTNYWINVFLAVFGSSLVMALTSVWGYFSERNRYERHYATFARDFLLQTARFLNQYNNEVTSPHEIYTISGNLHSFYDCFAYEKDSEIYGYFLKNSRRKARMKQIHTEMYDISRELSNIEFLSQNAFHNNETAFTFQTNLDISKLDKTMKMIIEVLHNQF